MNVETYAIRGDPLTDPSRLTSRQVMVLRCLAQGQDVDDIANQLGYSYSTIKKEVHVTIRRCCARNRAHAVAMAIRSGII